MRQGDCRPNTSRWSASSRARSRKRNRAEAPLHSGPIALVSGEPHNGNPAGLLRRPAPRIERGGKLFAVTGGSRMQADYVIVGAGSAGCVLANRLSADPAVRVILIEAGGRDWNPLIHIPAGFMKLLDHKTLTWGFKAQASEEREIIYPRGRVLGGSS